MKRFWGFVKKEFLHILRDKRSLTILFGIPIVQILLFGYVITNEIKNAQIAILDNSKDYLTQKITDKILSSGYFQLAGIIDSYTQIEEQFKAGKVKQILVFENNFAERFEKEGKANIQIIGDASDPNTASILSNYTQAIINDFVRSQVLASNNIPQIVVEPRMLYNSELKGAYMFIPGTMAMLLMLISAMMTSISITREKELGTMEVLLVSPLRPMQIILGKVTPYVLLSFINAVVIIILGNTVFGVPVKGSVFLLLFEGLLFITMALSLGILISTVAKTQQVAMMISLVALMLPTILLSGFIFPIENMPDILQYLSSIMPPRYFIVIVKNIMLKGTGLEFVLKETLILLGMTLLFIAISIKKFKTRLE